MKKQTAVQYLQEKIFNIYGIVPEDISMWNYALDLEREQINTAFHNGVGHAFYPKGNPLRYYEETYNGGEQ
jgi:hypothetical protein